MYGVFVSPQGSDVLGAGTRAAPYKTLAKGLQVAKGNVNRVYACDSGTGYTDALVVDATFDGTRLYGGFECAGWTYATTRRAKVHPASGVPLTVKALTVGFTVEDVEFDAADAATGQSSIGVIVDTALNVVLRGVRVVSGKGGAGAAGADGGPGAKGDTAMSSQDGLAGGCLIDGGNGQLGGSWGGASMCGSAGGSGGQASRGPIAGNPGGTGVPLDNVESPNTPNGGAVGMPGEVGSRGVAGAPGASATAGTFASTGFAPGPGGGAGTDGYVGQGGGGGGASNAPSGCMGASGGAGGMGGCGGGKGTGGGSGGASLAVLVWTSTLTFDHCELVGSDGGSGGNGGNGGSGGKGAAGGNGGAGSAGDAATGVGKGGSGGVGGDGGAGGPGAGGNGGPSYAVVYKGTAPSRINGTIVSHGAGGAKGVGAGTTSKAPDGAVGAAADDFPVP
jgi:hypothetical protein